MQALLFSVWLIIPVHGNERLTCFLGCKKRAVFGVNFSMPSILEHQGKVELGRLSFLYSCLKRGKVELSVL